LQQIQIQIEPSPTLNVLERFRVKLVGSTDTMHDQNVLGALLQRQGKRELLVLQRRVWTAGDVSKGPQTLCCDKAPPGTWPMRLVFNP
jgi:hypothetical protein